MNSIYLDNHTTTRPCGPAIERMLYYLKENWGVPSSLHSLGTKITQNLEQHYQPIYAIGGADPEDTFIFSSSSAEAVNHAIFGSYLEYTRKEGKNQFISCATEDAPILSSLQRLEEVFGCYQKILPVQGNGQIDTTLLENTFTPKTALLSLSWAHGLTGVIQPVEEIARICQKHGIPLHVDATYALGKVYISCKDTPIFFLTFSGNCIHAPQSTGGLFIQKNRSLPSFMIGGNEQLGLRASHFDMASFAALSAACQQAMLYQDQMGLETARLRDKLQVGLLQLAPYSQVLFQESSRLPNVLVMSFKGVWHEALLYALNRKGIYASSGGSFCQPLFKVLLACGFISDIAHSSLSFSLSRNTTEEEIDKAIEIIASEVKKLQLLSQGI